MDDFALYGDTYGTLLADAETRLPLTLWEGKDAEQLSQWLREHPGVEIACRDGSLTYRQGIADGAPQVVQVSDRFHCTCSLLSSVVPGTGERTRNSGTVAYPTWGRRWLRGRRRRAAVQPQPLLYPTA
ncbi:transposase [Streptomyces xiangluensis]|uniref:Transposase n=1 Tax=Streptomyces xiangluensis TaxID=2665720 RepID=A0ABV8YJ65_9ACTN